MTWPPGWLIVRWLLAWTFLVFATITAIGWLAGAPNWNVLAGWFVIPALLWGLLGWWKPEARLRGQPQLAAALIGFGWYMAWDLSVGHGLLPWLVWLGGLAALALIDHYRRPATPA